MGFFLCTRLEMVIISILSLHMGSWVFWIQEHRLGPSLEHSEPAVWVGLGSEEDICETIYW